MEKMFVFLPALYNIAGYQLLVQKEKRLTHLYGPDIFNAFLTTKQEKEPDFTLTLLSNPPEVQEDCLNTVVFKDGEVSMNYGSESERLFLHADQSMKNWQIYSNKTGSCLDNWFPKLGNLFAWSVLNHGALVLHAVILEWNGRGILLTAPSGTGKSTHARFWREYENALVINGDRALLRKQDGIWYAHGTPWSGSSGECVNRKVPLSAIVFLSQGKENIANSVSAIEAFPRILSRIIAPQEHIELSQKAIEYAASLVEDVPFVSLQCRPDRESVEILKKAILDIKDKVY